MVKKNNDQINCPYCDELISSKAKKCKHCGEILDPQLREIEFLKNQKSQSQVFMNNAAATTAIATPTLINDKKRWNHKPHILMTIITIGYWSPIYLIAYLLRNKDIYY